jgi:insulysin
MQQISNPESLLHRFNCGNVKSLSQPGIRQSLLDFHKKWYSSNIMTLTVLSRHPVTDLEKWVSEKFSPVVNTNVVVPDLGAPAPYPEEKRAKLVKFVPVQDKDVLSLYWILPYVQKDLKTQPLNYFSHLFGHEGENSLLSYLVSEGLALELCASADHELWSFSSFQIDITLTKKGLENYERVIEAVF